MMPIANQLARGPRGHGTEESMPRMHPAGDVFPCSDQHHRHRTARERRGQRGVPHSLGNAQDRAIGEEDAESAQSRRGHLVHFLHAREIPVVAERAAANRQRHQDRGAERSKSCGPPDLEHRATCQAVTKSRPVVRRRPRCSRINLLAEARHVPCSDSCPARACPEWQKTAVGLHRRRMEIVAQCLWHGGAGRPRERDKRPAEIGGFRRLR